MAFDSLKSMARSRALKCGHFVVEFATPGIGHILKGAGCDFVLFDTEHSGFGHETIKSALRYFEAAQLPAIVRVPSKEYHHIARAADAGAEGVMLPMVSDAAEARGIVSLMGDAPEAVKGEPVLLVDDIHDTGRTLAFTRRFLIERGARQVWTCTLLDKPSRREVESEVDFVGFTIPDVFIVGYGIDWAERYRHLPFIGRIVLAG